MRVLISLYLSMLLFGSSINTDSLFYPFVNGDTNNPQSDDGSSPMIQLLQPFKFFENTYDKIYVNNNGHLTFDGPWTSWSPYSFPAYSGKDIIAPFWTDIDNRRTGVISYQQYTSGDVLTQATQDINQYFPDLSFSASWVFVATWDRVAYYRYSGTETSFQVVLISNGHLSFMLMNYGIIAVPLHSVQAGYDTIDSSHHFSITDSIQNDVTNLTYSSNVNYPGRWAFRTDYGPEGCQFNDLSVQLGDSFWSDDTCLERCTCTSSGLQCSLEPCTYSQACRAASFQYSCQNIPRQTCTISGDPHYYTFDNQIFHFQGTCTYVLSKACGNDLPYYRIEGKNDHRGSTRVSWTRMVRVFVYDQEIELIKDHHYEAKVNGTFRATPFILNNGSVQVYQSGFTLVISTDFGLVVKYDAYSWVTISVPYEYQNATCGLCGNFNLHPEDDFRSPSGEILSSDVDFANSWQVDGDTDPECHNVRCTGLGCLDCNTNDMSVYSDTNHCGIIGDVSGPFAACHSVFAPQTYVENCVYDLCLGGGYQPILCQALNVYAAQCQQHGVQLGQWRQQGFCEIQCPEHSHFESQGTSCPATCSDPSAPINCPLFNQESCICDDGYMLSAGTCVPEAACGCTFEGFYYAEGQSILLDEDCGRQCVCSNRTMICYQHQCGPPTMECTVRNGHRGCYDVWSFIDTTVVPVTTSIRETTDTDVWSFTDPTVVSETTSIIETTDTVPFYPFGVGDIENERSDDGSSAVIYLLQPFIFFGNTYSQIYVNNNGHLTFDGPQTSWSPYSFPAYSGKDIIAPFWTDIDNRRTGVISYQQYTSGDVLTQATQDINQYFPDLSFSASWVFVATWDRVAYYRYSGTETSFQVVLISNGHLSFMLTNYGIIAVPLHRVQAGYDTIDSSHHFSITDSIQNDVTNLTYSSNVNYPGRWAFRTDYGPEGCQFNDLSVQLGDSFWSDDTCLERCTCTSSGLQCSLEPCTYSQACRAAAFQYSCQNIPRQTCTISGDPHYYTFDNQIFHFQGTCTYVLSKACGNDLPYYRIEGKNYHRGSTRVSWTRMVRVFVYDQEIELIKDHYYEAKVNGTFRATPFILNNGSIQVYQSGFTLVISTDFGLVVTYDAYSWVTISVPYEYQNATCGLCGNFNLHPEDDFRSPSGEILSSDVDFANSWQVDGDTDPECHNVRCTGLGCLDCNTNDMSLYSDTNHCGILGDVFGPFAACHSVFAPQTYVENCVYDLCLGGGYQPILCQALNVYAAQCQQHGVQLGQWRQQGFCEIQCPEHSHFESQGTSCPATCSDPSAPINCPLFNQESCICDDGYILSAGTCVPEAACGCTFEGFYYAEGQSIVLDEDCGRQCVCSNRTMICYQHQCGPPTMECTVRNGQRGCYDVWSFTDTTVVPVTTSIRETTNTDVWSFTDPTVVPETTSIRETTDSGVLIFTDPTVVPETTSIIETTDTVPFYPFGVGDIENKCSDDGSSAVIYLMQPFIFFGNTYSQIYVNNNGHLTFDGPWTSWSPYSFPAYSGKDIITPFWTDIDNRRTGVISYQQYTSGDVLTQATQDINQYFPDLSFSASWVFVATWDRVAYYRYSGTETSFQVVLISNGHLSFMLMNYGIIALPLHCVQAGYDTIDSSHHFSITDSIQNEVTNLTYSSNVNYPGRWAFRTDYGPEGCQFNDLSVQLGDSFWSDDTCLERCTCTSSGLQCSLEPCTYSQACRAASFQYSCQNIPRQTCTISGDPHYYTFDNQIFHFQGTCTYVLSKACGNDLPYYRIEGKNDHRGSTQVSWTRMVRVFVYDQEIELIKDHHYEAKVNGTFRATPFILNNGSIQVYQSGFTLVISTDFGLVVTYDAYSWVTISVPYEYQNATCGLCGNFNLHPEDDFRSPSGEILSSDVDFANSWQVDGDTDPECHNVRCTGLGCLDCNTNDMSVYRDTNHCGILGDVFGPFAACHSVFAPQTYVENCVYDLCLGGGYQPILCQALNVYAAQCQQQGVPLGQWRQQGFCEIQCPEHSHFESQGTSCPATCSDPSAPINCPLFNQESCICDDGYILSAGTCVPEAACGCTFEGFYYAEGQSIVLDEDCGRQCVCSNRTMICYQHQCGPPTMECTVRNGQRGCYDVWSFIDTTVVPVTTSIRETTNTGVWSFTDPTVVPETTSIRETTDTGVWSFTDPTVVPETTSIRETTDTVMPCQLENSHYELCGTDCGHTCASSIDASCEHKCSEGCFCNDGFVRSAGLCVPVEQCGCLYDGFYYHIGEEFWNSECSQRCECFGPNDLRCSASSCPTTLECTVRNGHHGCYGEMSTCSVWGDPHYLTFDGAVAHFQGTCSYEIAQTCGNVTDEDLEFRVVATNRHRGNMAVSFVSVVDVWLSHHGQQMQITIEQTKQVKVNGNYSDSASQVHDLVAVYEEQGFVVVNAFNKLLVHFDGQSILLVRLSHSFHGSVCGMCGNYNGDPADDIALPSGDLAPNDNDFGNSWKSDTSTPGCGASDQTANPDECPFRQEYSDLCSIITNKTGPFQQCHLFVDPAPYYYSCVYDLCLYTPENGMLRSSVQAYEAACVVLHIHIPEWRSSLRCNAVDSCSKLNCNEDEWCGEKNGVYGCFCNEDHPRSDSFGTSQTCESSTGSISVSRCQLFEAGFSAHDLHLNDPSCRGIIQNGRVEFSFDNNEHICGTNLVANGTHYIYENFILGASDSAEGLITREKNLKLSFSCIYSLSQTLSMNMEINPLESIVHKTLPAGEGRYQVRMIPYQDVGFSQPFNGRMNVELDQQIFVEVRVDGVDSQQFASVIDRCWATPVNDPDYSLGWDLITGECPNTNDVTVELLQNGVSTSSRFSFSMFTFTANTTKVYLHCAVHLCLLANTNCSAHCYPGCHQREGRSLDFHDSASISMGPLVLSENILDTSISERGKMSGARGLCGSLIILLVSLLTACSIF